MEYIKMESYRTALKGEFVFHLHYDYMVEDKSIPGLDHWEMTPGLSYGITDRLMLDIHTHFAKFGFEHILPDHKKSFTPLGPSPFMEAIAFSLQYRFIESSIIDIAFVGSYELPLSRSKLLLGGEQVFEGRLVLSKDFGAHNNICINLACGKDGHESYQEWALGFRTPLSQNPHGIAAGIEFLGDFDDNLSVVTGIYIPLATASTVLKIGLQFSNGIGADNFNTTLMHRF